MSLTRREFPAAAAAPAAIAAPRQPSLLYVFSDKHRACSMPGEPFDEALTPHLEQFARKA